jgi:hypothetical protein
MSDHPPLEQPSGAAPPMGPAGGALAGAYPNPTVPAISVGTAATAALSLGAASGMAASQKLEVPCGTSAAPITAKLQAQISGAPAAPDAGYTLVDFTGMTAPQVAAAVRTALLATVGHNLTIPVPAAAALALTQQSIGAFGNGTITTTFGGTTPSGFTGGRDSLDSVAAMGLATRLSTGQVPAIGADGRVTAATTADVAPSTNRNYITDAEADELDALVAMSSSIPFGNDSSTWDLPGLACETLGGFEVWIRAVMKGTGSGANILPRINGSATTNIGLKRFTDAHSSSLYTDPNYGNFNGYNGVAAAGNYSEGRIICLYPQVSVGGRAIQTEGISRTGSVFEKFWTQLEFGAAGGEITSIGLQVAGGLVFDGALSRYTLFRRNWNWGVTPSNIPTVVSSAQLTAGEYDVLATDSHLQVTATATEDAVINLLAGTSAQIVVTDSGRGCTVNAITIIPNGAETINGASSYEMSDFDGMSVTLRFCAATSNWDVL